MEKYFQEFPIMKVIMNDDKLEFIPFIESEDFIEDLIIFYGPYPIHYDDYLTYLDICCFYGSVHCFKLLRTKFNSQIRTESLELAFLGGNPEIISECLKVIRPNRHCMVNAIKSHNIDFVTYLRNEFEIEIGLSTCAYYKNLRAFLVYLDLTNDINTCFIYSPLFQIQSLCEYLLSQGVDFRSKDEARSALFSALRSNRLEFVNLLISLGADIKAQNNYDQTPLVSAVESNNIKIIELLISHGAEINVANKWGIYPIQKAIARQNKEIVELLISHGADINVKFRNGSYPIHDALCEKNIDIVKLLISHGADVNLENERGVAPLLIAARKDDKEVVELLISHGADINKQNIHGNTVLDEIFYWKSNKIKHFLISKGAIHGAKWTEHNRSQGKCLLT
ncbi:ankyrin repeat protein, putative [Trichomonas vaginalis G3]|uniref:Ankyrin repeat protein, putative n=1 Tax=Trichomonas vaginalis (strain ATCC PRA-98 / G3) TaxID=412133 RepID=A2DQA1_TRIV3|nr:spectrin binding [Trichomonas vaginalis G3]EAY17358.1 ankyrin repeat protein, putative [Trichomonas vaginalis G3]KAI5491366.1 spectrin binding [Trichomonas vaginalis G3]|eukprot:XP_001330727.1 ankyrin repeat protein [Trichomonas vaginalis G3]